MKGFQGTLKTKEAMTYELGIRSKNAWIGEEILFMNPNQRFQYSATARTKVMAFQISRLDMLHRLDPDYLNQLINQATIRYKHIKERKETIDNSRSRIGRTSEFSKKARYEFESGRQSHLESIEEQKAKNIRKAGTKMNLVKSMTNVLENLGMSNIVAPPQETSAKKEKWNLAKVIGRDIFQGGQTIRGSHDFKQQEPTT